MNEDQTRIEIPAEDLNNDGKNHPNKPGEVRELPAGTIVKIAGMPLKAVFPITLETSSGAWKAIEE